MEIDEGLFMLGLKAAGMRVPFIPTRVGLGTDVLKHNPAIQLVDSPYDGAVGGDAGAAAGRRCCTSTAPTRAACARSRARPLHGRPVRARAARDLT
jgi:acyl CoA:acetate/3-ketoacid CoA transferase alpha subunit